MLISKLVSFTLFVWGAYLFFANNYEWTAMIFSIVFLSIYIFLLIIDTKLHRKIQLNKNIQKIYSNELSYLNGDFSVFDEGTKYIDPNHPFTFDFDIFGKDSLFNRINRTITNDGSNKLATKLQSLLSNKHDIKLRREAIKELADNEQWRTRFIALGFKSDSDFESIVKVIKGNFKESLLLNGILHKVMLLSVFTTIATIILSVYSIVPTSIPTILFFLQLTACIMYSLKFNKISSEVSGLFKGFSMYALLIDHIAGIQFEATINKKLQSNLISDNSLNAKIAFRELSAILNRLEQRASVLMYILFSGLFLYDLFLLRKFVVWKDKYLNNIDLWVNAITEFDSLISFATYQFNNPKNVDVFINESDGLVVKTEGIYHPFIPLQKAITNDFYFKKNSFAIITGANMAGKSTFLWTIGVNYIMAMNGLPVCASYFEVSIMNLFSSMRTSDSLTNDISYFNAELIRLERLIKNCKEHEHTLIILDEILKGTNSKDKLDGSRLFLKEISKLNVSGIIATHDLELAKLEEDYQEQFKNYCFEIELSDEINYTYKISRGVAHNLNATYLLKKIIEQV
jgi:ABC-type multidrug transport system fused ATPase/permease subunit